MSTIQTIVIQPQTYNGYDSYEIWRCGRAREGVQLSSVTALWCLAGWLYTEQT